MYIVMQKIKSTKIEGVISEIIDQYAYADQLVLVAVKIQRCCLH